MEWNPRRLEPTEVAAAIALAWETYLEFEAPDYGPAGVDTFRRSIVENAAFHENCRSGRNRMWGAFDGERLASFMAMSGRSHICLVFTDEDYHRRGAGSAVWRTLLADVLRDDPWVDQLTLNSSPYGLPFYRHLGWKPLEPERTVDGIRFTPLVYRIAAAKDNADDVLMLVRPSEEHEAAVLDYRAEHLGAGESDLHGAAMLDRSGSYAEWLHGVRRGTHVPPDPGRVLSDTFLAIRKQDCKLVGLIDIRRELNDFLKQGGGHIGYGVRPSERRKGYAVRMLKLALDRARRLGLAKFMVGCERDNVPSRKTIERCGGKLERETVREDGRVVQIFEIEL